MRNEARKTKKVYNISSHVESTHITDIFLHVKRMHGRCKGFFTKAIQSCMTKNESDSACNVEPEYRVNHKHKTKLKFSMNKYTHGHRKKQILPSY